MASELKWTVDWGGGRGGDKCIDRYTFVDVNIGTMEMLRFNPMPRLCFHSWSPAFILQYYSMHFVSRLHPQISLGVKMGGYHSPDIGN